ncbi:MAG: hypothetical protein AAGA47_02985 [Pseudomonadota bacterium]
MALSPNRYLKVLAVFLSLGGASAQAQAPDGECDAQCQANRDAQDPTAEVNALFFDNTISFSDDRDETLYNFEIQGVRTLLSEDWGGLILRGIVPVLGVPVPDPPTFDLDTEWGISDTLIQLFYVPDANIGPLSFGFGPQVSLETHSEDELKGAGFGGGLAAGAFGFVGPWSVGGLANHLWGENEFSTTTLQPIVYYNFINPEIGNWFLGYNAQITYDWSAASADDAWSVPVGLSVGRTVLRPSGPAVSYVVGAYGLADSPNDAFDWQLKFAVNILSR